MTPADTLVQAIKERVAAGIDKETIKNETIAAGHTEEIFEAAYASAAEETQAANSELPSVTSLWMDGFNFFKEEWRFALILAIPLIVSAIADAIVGEGQLGSGAVAVLTAISVISSIAYVYLIIILVGKITQESAAGDYSTARAWAAKNWLKMAWVYILTALVVIGGFMLFIIPGFILSILLYFSYFAFAVDGHRGMSALQESRRLFRGRFLQMFLKLAGLTVITIAVFIMCMIVATGLLFLASSGGEIAAASIFGVVINIAAAAITLITLQAGYRFYLAAKATTTAEPKGTFTYKILAGIGLLIPIALIGLGVFLFSNQEFFLEELQMLEESADASEPVQFELQAASFVAATFQITNDNSFTGVCDIIIETAQPDDTVVCNDSAEAWALAIERNGEQWCADSTGYNKLLAAALAERTECLPL